MSWWNITTSRGRYTVKANDEADAVAEIRDHIQPGETFQDPENAGPHPTREAAEDA